nr:universal stress protein [Halorubrum saccharovorum]
MTIVAAVDRSERASNVVDEAAALARAFDEPVHVVHALTRSEFLDLGITSAQAEEPKDMNEIREAASEMAAEAVQISMFRTKRSASSVGPSKKSCGTPTRGTRGTSL